MAGERWSVAETAQEMDPEAVSMHAINGPIRLFDDPGDPHGLTERVAELVAEFGAAAVVAVIAEHESPLMIGRKAPPTTPMRSGSSSTH
jgi:hypothetical protein